MMKIDSINTLVGLILKKANNAYLIVFIAIVFVLRLTGDTILFVFDRIDSPVSLIWKIITSFLIILAIFLIFFKEFILEPESAFEKTIEDYFKELKKILLFSVFLLAFYIFPIVFNIRTGEIDSVFSLFYCEILGLFSIITNFQILRFLYRWLLIRRHKRTKLFLNILRNGLQYFFLVEFLIHVFGFLKNSFVDILSVIIIAFLLILVFLVTKKNSWIILLSKPMKLKLLWQTLFGMIITLSIANAGLINKSSLHLSLIAFMPGTATLVGTSFLFATIYFFRLFFAVIVALPSSAIVERRTSEISSLTYLNKLVADTINYDNLLETVTKLAMDSVGGIAAWTELYSNDGKISIASAQNIEHLQIDSLDEKSILADILKKLDKPILVDSISDHPIISSLTWETIPLAKSLIAVPLYSGDEKIGSLVILSNQEYGYEQDDIKVLSAFSDNVSVAFENARLVKDSIEKERYKRELLLAREIEEKLLPRILPKINNYSLSAFSSPAEEVGGDYYDLVHLKDGKPCLLIGDVSGKGISAAFHMAQLKGVVLAVAPESSGASDILKRINATLYGAMEKQMYITLSAVVVNDENGNITIARAGHMPFLFKHNGDITSILPKGIGIGLAEKSFFNANIEETDCIMQKGDICLLFTDGVNELQNHKNEEFGINSLKQVLRYEIHKNIENLLSDIRIQLKNYSGNVPPHDDMTIVALEFSDKTNTI